jgi:DNA-binding transcriptional ArsR family regulator
MEIKYIETAIFLQALSLQKENKSSNLLYMNGTCCNDAQLELYSEKLKVCGHPIRLKILCLIEKEDACVTELWHCLGQAQPVVSQHLAVLKEKGIVTSEIKGNRRIYSICDEFIKKIIQSIEA